jgi:hypothetical protein
MVKVAGFAATAAGVLVATITLTCQFGYEGRQAFIESLCPAIFDRYIAAFDETDFAESSEKGGQWRVRPAR